MMHDDDDDDDDDDADEATHLLWLLLTLSELGFLHNYARENCLIVWIYIHVHTYTYTWIIYNHLNQITFVIIAL